MAMRNAVLGLIFFFAGYMVAESQWIPAAVAALIGLAVAVLTKSKKS